MRDRFDSMFERASSRPAHALVGRDLGVRPPAIMTPLFHITLPSLDDNSVESHFAPLVFALEGMIAINRCHIARSLRRAMAGLGEPVPPLYASGVRYREDDAGREDWRDVFVILGRGLADCLPTSTLVLRDDYQTVSMAELRPGDRIMGERGWTRVLEHAITGDKPILAFELSNGCTLRCSPEHQIFRDVDGVVETIRAKDARVGDDLVMASAAPMAEREAIAWPESLTKLSETDRAWLLGVFVADGWVDGGGHRASISGLDGKVKEAQKRRVEAMMASIGVSTTWNTKYIAINDRPIAEFFATCGHRAMNKRLPSLAFSSEAGVRAALDGLAADAGRAKTGDESSALVYGTTSHALALQLRALYRMLGLSVSVRRVDDHGGLGKNPIYRVIPREKVAPGTAPRRDKTFARIRSIADDGVELCADITTDTGKFWLPESDVLVHNCDNLVAWRVAELREAGIWAEPVIKWQFLPYDVAVTLGFPPDKVSRSGLWLIHCCVRFEDGTVEDPSKELGMGGGYTNRV